MSDSQRLWIALIVLVMLVAASAAVAFGQESTDEKLVPRDGDQSGGDSPWDWLQMLGALAIVVGLIFGTRYVLKRIGKFPVVGGSGEVFKVLAAKSLSAKHQIVLVSMGRRLLVVGCGPEGLATLGEVTDPDEIEELLENMQTSPKQARKVENQAPQESAE